MLAVCFSSRACQVFSQRLNVSAEMRKDAASASHRAKRAVRRDWRILGRNTIILPFSLLLPCPYIQPSHLHLPTPSDQSGPAARGYQSPSCVGPVKWKMAATERAHFREPSSFEGAGWPLTATVLTRSPHERSAAIIVFTKARGEERGSKGDPVGSGLNQASEPRHCPAVGKHDMASLTARCMTVRAFSKEAVHLCFYQRCVIVCLTLSSWGQVWLLQLPRLKIERKRHKMQALVRSFHVYD